MSKFPNLELYFKNKSFRSSDWKSFPIILRWMQVGRMDEALKIIDKKVGYLLTLNVRKKVEEWFSDDKHIIQTTAERYILDYLRNRNTNYEENFSGNGVDAYLNKSGEKIGIEATTINKTLTEELFRERLLMYLHLKGYKRRERIEISCSIDKLIPIGFYIYDLIEDIGNVILQNTGNVKDVSIIKSQAPVGYISWGIKENSNFNLLDFLDKRLSEIITSKQAQLSKNSKNILFIGVNELPIDHLNPEIFKQATKPEFLEQELKVLEDIISKNLPDNILGICFFVYSIDQEKPYYSLRIFWKDNSNTISINI